MILNGPVLRVRDLTVYYYTLKGVVHAVEEANLIAYKGELIALVGESGSGKSTLGYALLKLVPPPGRIIKGKVLINGIDVLALKGEELRKVRGSLISMVFQDPFTTLDPVRKVGDQILEVLVEHGINIEEGKERVRKVLEAVGLPTRLANAYPHQLSGGQRQRISIATAVALNPKVLVADEPTTALDVIVQKQIMDLLDEIRNKTGMVIVLITHDIALAVERADRIAVMYAGNIVEYGPKDKVLENPLHPYTQALLRSVPDIESREWPKPIPGLPPDLRKPPSGCRFHPRCGMRMNQCSKRLPGTIMIEKDHYVSCWLYMKR